MCSRASASAAHASYGSARSDDGPAISASSGLCCESRGCRAPEDASVHSAAQGSYAAKDGSPTRATACTAEARCTLSIAATADAQSPNLGSTSAWATGRSQAGGLGAEHCARCRRSGASKRVARAAAARAPTAL